MAAVDKLVVGVSDGKDVCDLCKQVIPRHEGFVFDKPHKWLQCDVCYDLLDLFADMGAFEYSEDVEDMDTFAKEMADRYKSGVAIRYLRRRSGIDG